FRQRPPPPSRWYLKTGITCDAQPAPGGRPLFWVSSAKRDLLKFPEAVKDGIGTALSVAQFGGKHLSVKPWKGAGSGVLQTVEDNDGTTYRAVYTVRFRRAIYVLHCSQKKSRTGIQTPKTDVELVLMRWRLATQDYEDRYGIVESEK